MTRDEHAEWLAGIAVELARRVREDLPCDYRDWLHANTTPADREALLYVQAAANNPDGWLRATAWVRRPEPPFVDEVAVDLARRGEIEPARLNRWERLAAYAELQRAGVTAAVISARTGLTRRQIQRLRAGEVKAMGQLERLRGAA